MARSSFPRLPVLEDLVGRILLLDQAPLRRTCVVCVQHLLESTGSLLNACVQLGIAPESIFVLGKSYSANNAVLESLISSGVHVKVNRIDSRLTGFQTEFAEVVRRMWNDVAAFLRNEEIDRILIVDDGGHCIEQMPLELIQNYKVAGI